MPIPELMLLVVLGFIALPLYLAVRDEVREYRFRNWQARERRLMLTLRKER